MPNLSFRTKIKSLLHRNVAGDEKWYFLKILNARDHGLILFNRWPLPKDEIASDGSRCGAFGMISKVSYISSSPNLVKLSLPDANRNNWSNCTALCLEKSISIRKDTITWFSFMTTHHRTHLIWSRTTYNQSTQRCYPTPYIHRTFVLSSIICFVTVSHTGGTACPFLWNFSKHGLMSGLPEKKRFVCCVIHGFPKIWEIVYLVRSRTLSKFRSCCLWKRSVSLAEKHCI